MERLLTTVLVACIFGFANTWALEEIPKHIPTTLESITGDLPVYDLLVDDGGKTWIATPRGVFQVTANDTDDPTSLGTRLTKAYSGHSTSLIAVPRASPLIVTVDGLVLDTSLPTENEIYKARKTSPNLKRLDVSFWNSMLVINGTGTTISHQHPSDYRIETAEKLFPDYRASETVIANRGPNLCAVDREKFTCVDPAFSQTVISFLRPSLEAAPTRVAFSEASNTFAVITSGGRVAVYAQAEPQPDHQINEEFGLPVEATELFFLDETLLIGATTGLYFSSPPYSTIESLDYGKNTRVLGFRQAHGGVYVLTETGASYIELSNIRSWPGSERPVGRPSFCRDQSRYVTHRY